MNFLTEISHKKRSNSSVISYFNYERDQIGNITKITSAKGDANYTYDGNNQLINATHPEVATSVFAYDPLGNRVTDQDGVYVYDNKKQHLDEDWQYRYVYDNNGNLTSKISKSDPTKITSYSYNSSNQLILLKELDGSLEVKESRYFYDASGRRIVKDYRDHVATSNSFVRKFVYDGEDILFEINDQNDLLASYTHSKIRSDDVLSMDRMGVSYFYLKDHLGSVHEILNSSGNLVQKYVYSAFGKILKIEDSGGQVLSRPIVENFYTFTGRESDFETGLNYYRARYYDVRIGRFLMADAHSGFAGSPLTLVNKYSYVVNNPLGFVDPSGLFSLKRVFSYYLSFINIYSAIAYINSDDVYSEKDTRRLTNATITATVFAYAFFFSPGNAIVSLGSTSFSRRDKGNPFDDLHFAGQFGFSYGSSLLLNYSGITSYTKLNWVSITTDMSVDFGLTLSKEFIDKDAGKNSPSDRPLFAILFFSNSLLLPTMVDKL